MASALTNNFSLRTQCGVVDRVTDSGPGEKSSIPHLAIEVLWRSGIDKNHLFDTIFTFKALSQLL